jgi:glycolate oxidase FAD binding subunit
LRLTSAHDEALIAGFGTLRAAIEGLGGSLVALDIPAPLKARIDVWGAQGDDLPLMRRVKAQFDPVGTLNPGRFVGGI